MKNKQEFIKKINIASESFVAIENFYGKMKLNPHQKTKFINSIKKEINKITRIKEVNLNMGNSISLVLFVLENLRTCPLLLFYSALA